MPAEMVYLIFNCRGIFNLAQVLQLYHPWPRRLNFRSMTTRSRGNCFFVVFFLVHFLPHSIFNSIHASVHFSLNSIFNLKTSIVSRPWFKQTRTACVRAKHQMWRCLVWYWPFHSLSVNWSKNMWLASYTQYSLRHGKGF